MVEPSFLALTTTPSMTGSAAELTFPASAAADWANAGAARPSWSRTAAVAAVEASNAFRIRIAFPSGLDRVAGLDLDEWKLAEFGRLAGCAGKAVLERTSTDSLNPRADRFKAVPVCFRSRREEARITPAGPLLRRPAPPRLTGMPA